MDMFPTVLLTAFCIYSQVYYVTSAVSDKRVTACYFTNWSQYRKGIGQFKADDLNARLCTHIFYAFANIDIPTLTLKHTEWNDIPTRWDQGNYRRVVSLKRRNPSMRIFLSVGGWKQGASGFSSIVKSNRTRKTFAENAVTFLRKHRFDGLDLDWEYPGTRGSQREDVERYCELIKTLREEFEEDFITRETYPTSNRMRRRLQISSAIPSTKLILDGFTCLHSIASYADLLITPAYNYHGNWEWFAAPGSPLFSSTDEIGIQSTLNVNWTVSHLLEEVPPQKLLLGMPLFAKTYELENSGDIMAGSAAVGPGSKGNYTGEEGILAYYEVCETLKEEGWKSYWDSERAVPIAVRGTEWIGYEDTRSLVLKALLARERGLGGVALWALDLDDSRGRCGQGKFPLVANIRRALGLWRGRQRRLMSARQPGKTRQKRHATVDKTDLINKLINGWRKEDPIKAVHTGMRVNEKDVMLTSLGQVILGRASREHKTQQLNRNDNGEEDPKRKPTNSGVIRNGFSGGFLVEKPFLGSYADVRPGTGYGAGEGQRHRLVMTNRHKRSAGNEIEKGGACQFDSVMADKNDCRYYYQCSDGSLYLFFCGPGAVFDPEVKSCVSPNRLERCAGLSTAREEPRDGGLYVCDIDGYYRDPKDCNKFYRCASNIKHYFSCPDGLVFKESSSSCDFPIHVKECKDYKSPTKRKEKVDPKLKNLTGGAKALGDAKLKRNRSKKRRLDGGKSLRFEKLPSESFTAEDLPALREEVVDVQEEEEGKSEEGESVIDTKNVDTSLEKTPVDGFNCPGDGYYRDIDDCKKFYHCSNGMSYRISCNGGLVFNYITGICDWPDRVPGCSPTHFILPHSGNETEPRYIDLDQFTRSPGNDGYEEETGFSENLEELEHRLQESDKRNIKSVQDHDMETDRTGSALETNSKRQQQSLPYKRGVEPRNGKSATKNKVSTGFHDCEPTGFRRDAADCRIFYICSADGTEHKFRCAEELVFNIEKGYCEAPGTVPGCPSTRAKPGSGNMDGRLENSIDGPMVMPHTAGQSDNPALNSASTAEGEKKGKGGRCKTGALLPHPHSCTRYLRCIVDTWIVASCPPHHYFNTNTKQCDTNAGRSCQHNRPRRYRIAKRFSQVEKQDDIETDAQMGKLMDDPGAKLELSAPVDGETCKDAGSELLPDKTDCVSYFRCVQGIYVRMRCDQRLAFRADLGRCDWEELVPSCHVGLEPMNYNRLLEVEEDDRKIKDALEWTNHRSTSYEEFVMPEMRYTFTQPSFICPGDGLFSHPYDCTYFYQCSAGEATAKKCPAGLVFDSQRQLCDHVQKVPECFMYQIEAPHFNSLPLFNVDNRRRNFAEADKMAFSDEVDLKRPTGKSIFVGDSQMTLPSPNEGQVVKSSENESENHNISVDDEASIRYIPYDSAVKIEDILKRVEEGSEDLPTVDSIQSSLTDSDSDSGEGRSERKDSIDALGHYVHGAIVTEVGPPVRLEKKGHSSTGDKVPTSDKVDVVDGSEEELVNMTESSSRRDDQARTGPPVIDRSQYIGHFVCSRSGLFADVEECSMYFMCSHELEVKHLTCGEDLVYNENTELCDEPINVPECFDGNLEYELTASPSTHVKAVQPVSNAEDKYQEDVKLKDKDFSDGIPCTDGLPVPDPNDCTRYYQCKNSGIQITYCPLGQLFNERIGMCDAAQNVPHCFRSTVKKEEEKEREEKRERMEEERIEERKAQGSIGEEVKRDPTPPPAEKTETRAARVPYRILGRRRLRCADNGYVRDSHDCSIFYYCNSGLVYEFKCAAGLAFDPEQLQCEWPSRVEGCEDTWGRGDGF